MHLLHTHGSPKLQEEELKLSPAPAGLWTRGAVPKPEHDSCTAVTTAISGVTDPAHGS